MKQMFTTHPNLIKNKSLYTIGQNVILYEMHEEKNRSNDQDERRK